MPGKVLLLDLTENSDTVLTLLKALSSETRLAILAYLGERTVNVNEIASALQIAPSSATTHIQILEKADLVRTEFIPATHGLQKLCGRTYDDVHIRLEKTEKEAQNTFTVAMPIGQYVDFEVYPTCGVVNETSMIGLLDTPSSFYEPAHVSAQLLWFGHGHVTYRFPNHLPSGTIATRLDLSGEICSEAPLHHLDWPSDITLWVNGVEVGTWTSPADFGGARGLLTPEWWELKDTQYGLLKVWSVNHEGSFIDGKNISDIQIERLKIKSYPYIEVTLGVKEDAQNVGGMNLFGERFGNYPQPLVLKVTYDYLESAKNRYSGYPVTGNGQE